VTGKGFASFLEERIFRPLGMTATRLYDFRELIKNRATGYTWENDALRNFEPWSPTQTYAAGAMASTVLDLAKWDAALYTERPLPRASRERMWTKAVLNDGKPTDYGLGWAIGNEGGRPWVAHGGGLSGFVTFILRCFEDRLTVIVLTNSDTGSPGDIAFTIARYYLPDPPATAASDSPTTERLRQVLVGLAEGHADPALFAPAAWAALSPALRETSAFYRSLGPLRSFQLIEQTKEGEEQVYRYRTVFKGAPCVHRCVLTGEGKIAAWTVSPA
jgi:CubicO group peptidase (beta-lactamase class C family)